MKLFKKTTMAVALSAAMIGGLVMAPQASALPNPSGASNANVNPNNMGQALTFPYYTVRDGQKSFFNITNITGDTVAVKIRFHESLNSRDVLDFIVVLSPYDAWSAWIEGDDANDTAPAVKTNDNSCIVGNGTGTNNIYNTGEGGGLKLNNLAYFGDGFTDFPATNVEEAYETLKRTKEGYMVAQVMGVVPGENAVNSAGAPVDSSYVNETQSEAINGNSWDGSVAYNALHQADGTLRAGGCANVNKAFTANAPLIATFPFSDANQNGDGDAKAILEFSSPLGASQPNALKGNFSIINSTTGIGAGITAVAIADMINFGTYGTTSNGLLPPSSTGVNLITAQNFPYFLEPTLASGDGIWTVSGLAAVETALTSFGVNNEWAENESTGARTDWVISFPTKGFHVDNKAVYEVSPGDFIGVDYVIPFIGPAIPATNPAPNIQAAVNTWRVDSQDLVGEVFENNLTQYGAAVKIDPLVYDREELGFAPEGGDTTPSPAPPVVLPDVTLMGEANVITFGKASTAAGGGNSALGAKNFVINIDAAAILGNSAPNGWFTFNFGDPSVMDLEGLPTVGYLYKVRNQGDVATSYGQIMSHGWTNYIDPNP